MNLPQLIDPERAVAAPVSLRQGAEQPTTRTHLAPGPLDRRHDNAKLDHLGRKTAGDGPSRRALRVLVVRETPVDSVLLAKLLKITKQKASMTLTNLMQAQYIIRVTERRPYGYRPTEKGRNACV